MTPTLVGRLQTRVVLLLVVGVPWALLIGPVLPGVAPGASLGAVYLAELFSLLVIMMLGLVWELLYHLAQQYRWDKDWPTLFGLVTALNEGALVWLLIVRGDFGGRAIGTTTFVVHFLSTWIVVWAVANGPLRVVLFRWRFRGGRIVRPVSRRVVLPGERVDAHASAVGGAASAAGGARRVTPGPVVGGVRSDSAAAHEAPALVPRRDRSEESARGWGVARVSVRGLVCAKCGGFNPLSVSHCVYDGNRLNATVFAAVGDGGELVVGELGARPPLGVLTGLDGREIRVDCDLVLGRAPDESPLVRARHARPVVLDLDDLGISRVHCTIDLADWKVFVRDAGSSNGTFHRSAESAIVTRVPHGRAVRLDRGDAIRIGSDEFVYSPHF